MNEVKRLKQDNYLRQKFDLLDKSKDGRVDTRELKDVRAASPRAASYRTPRACSLATAFTRPKACLQRLGGSVAHRSHRNPDWLWVARARRGAVGRGWSAGAARERADLLPLSHPPVRKPGIALTESAHAERARRAVALRVLPALAFRRHAMLMTMARDDAPLTVAPPRA